MKQTILIVHLDMCLLMLRTLSVIRLTMCTSLLLVAWATFLWCRLLKEHMSLDSFREESFGTYYWMGLDPYLNSCVIPQFLN